jgi:hypothetical protein
MLIQEELIALVCRMNQFWTRNHGVVTDSFTIGVKKRVWNGSDITTDYETVNILGRVRSTGQDNLESNLSEIRSGQEELKMTPKIK